MAKEKSVLTKIDQPESKGFTIIELLIATAVFSSILLLLSAAVIQITRTYYKGIIISRTQETARSIASEISQAIEFAGGQVIPPCYADRTIATTPCLPSNADGSIMGFCVGNTRYSYIPYKEFTNTSGPIFVRDTNVDNCAGSHADITSSSTELLGLNMRLDNSVTLTDKGDGVYAVDLHILYGDNDLFNNVNADGTIAGSPHDKGYEAGYPDHTCIASRFGGQFCADSTISLVANKRIQ